MPAARFLSRHSADVVARRFLRRPDKQALAAARGKLEEDFGAGEILISLAPAGWSTTICTPTAVIRRADLVRRQLARGNVAMDKTKTPGVSELGIDAIAASQQAL
jgi:hypothetical protein